MSGKSVTICCDVKRVPTFLRYRVMKAAESLHVDPVEWAARQIEKRAKKIQKRWLTGCTHL